MRSTASFPNGTIIYFITLFALLFFFPLKHFAQEPEIWLKNGEHISYPKLYLHTDREVYFPGDSIWFKAYYLDGQSQWFFQGRLSLYVDLLDEQGQAIISQVLLLEYGQSAGRIEIPDSINSGNFVLRAFTDYQRNLGEDMFFHKVLRVTSIENALDKITQSKIGRPPKIDVSFLPEGGYLLAGQNNVLGIKAIDESGKGISVKGKILTGDGEVVSSFETRYRGMDTIHFTPLRKESYRVEIKAFPEFEHEISDIKTDGIKLEYVSKSRYELLFCATTNSKRLQGKDYHFVIMHRSKVIYQQGFFQGEKDIPIKINRIILPGGINRFVLLNDQLEPISERLLFLKKDNLHVVKISLDKENYKTRSKVQLELLDEMVIDGEYASSLSLAVVEKKAIGKNGPEMNIQSWLLIDSELKGNIESPTDYFKDDEVLSSFEKLDLLMLTHGWSKYIWNDFPKNEMSVDYIEEEGFSIRGSVSKNYSKQAIVNGKVYLALYNNEGVFTRETRTDRNGMFSFDGLGFTDTVAIFLQAWNEKGKSFKRVDINPLFMDSPTVSGTYLPTTGLTLQIPKELKRQKYYNDISLREYIMKTGSFFIKEVKVVSKKGDGIERSKYSKPSSSLKVTMADYSYPDVFYYLQGRVSGLTVSYIQGPVGLEPQIRIRRFGSTYGSTDVLFLLNGMPVSKETIQYLPLCDIDVIDVLKSIGETSIFGFTGANGIIAVYTKKGLSDEEWNANPIGIISEKICGYSADRQFYSPAYTAENIDTERPDHRMTLYWNPYVISDNGKASVSFFTSDDIARYKIFLEGITQTGEICLGTAEFVVD